MKTKYSIIFFLISFLLLSCSSGNSTLKSEKDQNEIQQQEENDSNAIDNNSLIEQVLNDSNTKYIYAVVTTKEGLLNVILQVIKTYNYEFDLYRIVFMKEVILNEKERYQFYILIFNKAKRQKSGL